MGYDLWNHSKFLHHKVRNMMRRGWLLRTYNDGKMLRGRVKTGEKIENDKIDILHPVGYVAHVKHDSKCEIITQDVGGDTSRRVISWVLGDREYHPKPDEGEAFFYAPGDKKHYTRMKKKKEGGEDQGGDQAGGQQSDGRTVDYKREPGTHTEGTDLRITSKTTASYANQADKGAGISTKDGSMTIAAGQNTQFQASKHIRRGETHRDSPMFVNGVVHASDHYAGGGTSISGSPRLTREARAGQSDDEEPERPQEDGTQAWSATGQPGTTSLLQTAAKVGTMGGMMGTLSGMMGLLTGMMGQGGGGGQQQQDLEQKLRELEEQLQHLQSQP